jgi:hypothetical protein
MKNIINFHSRCMLELGCHSNIYLIPISAENTLEARTYIFMSNPFQYDEENVQCSKGKQDPYNY